MDQPTQELHLGPRQPLLVISPWAKQNFVDNTLTDQSSVVRFIEDNFLGSQRIGQGSADANAGPLTNMFDFSQRTGQAPALLLDPSSGEPNASR
jgi:phospholipase C